ncbi:hypothetical protein [Sphingomonas sp.]|uniref:hypothetical protein n=1 Tax=Sphingomonas sp. TaxID=28214 RepID=UPI003B3AA1ED
MSSFAINPLLGEAEAVVPGIGGGEDGTDIPLRLKLSNAEWVQAERALGGLSYLDIVSAMLQAELAGRSVSLDYSRAVLWAATRRNHPALSIDQCGDLVMQHGDVVMRALGEAIRGSIRLKDASAGEA